MNKIAKTILFAVLIFMFIGVSASLVSCVSQNNGNDTGLLTNTETLTDETSMEPPIQLTVEKLRNDYDDNPFAADQAYKNKNLEITGKILTIDRNNNGVPYIDFVADNTQDVFTDVFCHFDKKDESSLAQVKRGQIVKIQGICMGQKNSNVLPGSSIFIDNCKIISAEDDQEPAEEHSSILYQYYNSNSPQEDSSIAIVPTQEEINYIMSITSEVDDPAIYFKALLQTPVTTSDGGTGWITAVVGSRYPTADGYGRIVFFWHNKDFIGFDSDHESLASSISESGPGYIQVSYHQYAPGDPLSSPSLPDKKIIYRWNGKTFSASENLNNKDNGLSYVHIKR